MTKLSELYVRTCNEYNKRPNPDQGESWVRVLGGYDIRDVESAVYDWKSDTSPNSWDGRPIGAMMPSPAEVKSLIERDKLRQAGQFSPCRKDGCENGWIYVASGLDIDGEVLDGKIGGVKRCECWNQYLCERFNCSRSELTRVIAERKQGREKRPRVA